MSEYWSPADERRYQKLTRLVRLVRLAEDKESRQARVSSAQHHLPTTQGTRTHTSHRVMTRVFDNGIEVITVNNQTSRKSWGYASRPSNPTRRTDSYIPFRDPGSGFQRPHASSYTNTAQQAYYGQRPKQAFYPETVQPSRAGRSPTYKEARSLPRGYPSTGSKAPPNPWSPSQQTSKPHDERTRRRSRAAEPAPPAGEPSLSVIQPASISEPPTVINAPTRPNDIVKMLPTPAGSEFTKAPPPTTRHTRDLSGHKRPVTHAYNAERRSSPHHRGNTATQPSKTGHSARASKTATKTQHSDWPPVEPLPKSTDTTQLSNQQPSEALKGSVVSTEAPQPLPLTGHSRRSKYPKTWEQFYKTSPSMVNGPREPPISARKKAQSEPSQTERSTLAARTKTARTERTQKTAETQQTNDTTQTADPPPRARIKRRGGLGVYRGHDLRDGL